jgi:hypothetical protein
VSLPTKSAGGDGDADRTGGGAWTEERWTGAGAVWTDRVLATKAKMKINTAARR